MAIHRWEATDHAVYGRSGLFWEEWRAAPLSRVQTVDKGRGSLQRAFGLASVVVTTASAKGEVEIKALDADFAAEMVDRLTLLPSLASLTPMSKLASSSCGRAG